MCLDCGCGRPGPTRIDGVPAEEIASPILDAKGGASLADGHGPRHRHSHGDAHEGHFHEHEHEEGHEHPHQQDSGHRTVLVNQPILAANDRLAERNRGYFKALGLLVLNIVSSPGSGKTTLIQQTVTRLGSRLRTGVIVGDLETDNDARRLRESGARAVQVTTGTLCHLEAGMIARAMTALDPRSLDLLIIENVGNLVCPASFDLGEDMRVVVLSVTEGEDKPLKYPPIFSSAGAVIVSKLDMAEAAGLEMDTLRSNIRRACPAATVFELSAKTGVGVEAWCDYLLRKQGTPSRGSA